MLDGTAASMGEFGEDGSEISRLPQVKTSSFGLPWRGLSFAMPLGVACECLLMLSIRTGRGIDIDATIAEMEGSESSESQSDDIDITSSKASSRSGKGRTRTLRAAMMVKEGLNRSVVTRALMSTESAQEQ